MIKALILDLDNTIYPVKSIGAELFASLFDLIDQSGEADDHQEALREAIQRRPFQVVAAEFGFSNDLTDRGNALLRDIRYMGPIEPFPDFKAVVAMPQTKFLVTTGFTPLQNSKIDGMRIRDLFREIHIVDPMYSQLTKKDVFADILHRHQYPKAEVLVIGDDPHSEIKAARDLDLPVVLYDALLLYPEEKTLPRITNFNELETQVSMF